MCDMGCDEEEDEAAFSMSCLGASIGQEGDDGDLSGLFDEGDL